MLRDIDGERLVMLCSLCNKENQGECLCVKLTITRNRWSEVKQGNHLEVIEYAKNLENNNWYVFGIESWVWITNEELCRRLERIIDPFCKV